MFFSQDNVTSILLREKEYNIQSIPFFGTEQEWENYNLYIPKDGEFIIYIPDKSKGESRYRIKIGNGEKTVNQLDFIYIDSSDEEKELVSLVQSNAQAINQLKTKVEELEQNLASNEQITNAINTALNSAKEYTNQKVANISFPVNSVNGKTGTVTLGAEDVGADSFGAAETALEKAKKYADEEIAKISETIESPVTSVNGKTGEVILSAEEVGAAPTGFGLGTEPKFITDANDAILPGFYAPNGISCANIPSEWQFLYGTIIVSTGAGFIEQLFLASDKAARRTRSYGNGMWSWSEWADISPSSFAPSGYGLGNSTTSTITDFNQAIYSGWYRYDRNSANSPHSSTTGFVRVDSIGNGSDVAIEQRVWSHDWSSLGQIQLKRVCHRGVWSEWDYDYPLMANGGEYRTTERLNGKAVYKRYYNGILYYHLEGETEWKLYNKLFHSAPAGYGFGEEMLSERSTTMAKVNETVEDFHARIDAELAKMDNWSATLLMTRGVDGNGHPTQPYYKAGNCLGILYRHGSVNSATLSTIAYGDANPGCLWTMQKISGVWQEIEWVNPPMAVGVEYRTTERYNGKPVYAKAVDFGAVPNGTTASVSSGTSNVENVISCTGTLSNGTTIPYNSMSCSATRGTIYIASTTQNASYTAVITIKYTKTTD